MKTHSNESSSFFFSLSLKGEKKMKMDFLNNIYWIWNFKNSKFLVLTEWMCSPKYHDLLAVNKCQKSNIFSDLAPSSHTWIGFHFKKQGLLEDHSIPRPESTKGNGCSSTSHFCKSHIPKISGCANRTTGANTKKSSASSPY